MVSNLEEPRPQKLALDGLSERPHCMAVIEPRHTLSGCVEVGALLLPNLEVFWISLAAVTAGTRAPHSMCPLRACAPCAAPCRGCILISSCKHPDSRPLLLVENVTGGRRETLHLWEGACGPSHRWRILAGVEEGGLGHLAGQAMILSVCLYRCWWRMEAL